MTGSMTASVLRPFTIHEVLEALAAEPTPTLFAGGTDIMPAIRSGRRDHPLRWLALEGVPELGTIARETTVHGARMRIGSTATHEAVAAHPIMGRHATALRDACAGLGSPATRAWGTLGGTIAQASRSMDAASPLLALDAVIEVASLRRGTRLIPFHRFSRASERRDLAPDELIVAILLPESTGTSAFVKRAVRRAMDVAAATASASLTSSDGRVIDRATLAVGGLGPVARRLTELESRVRGLDPAAVRDLVREAVASEEPIESDDRVADDYRLAVAAAAVHSAIQLAWSRRSDHDIL
ncbi:xanthine dehydrogenase family protein subunit M [Herbiconiux sp. P15]|uniref:FAD binding domain-containing protein n=1 Tax=Herbiconiux liukaitaii TaxID=3342799 RepID=UPI0035BB29B7